MLTCMVHSGHFKFQKVDHCVSGLVSLQLIMKYYAQPTSSGTGVYLTSSEILEKINGGIKKPLSNVKLGEVEKKLDFPLRIIHGVTKHHVKELQ